MKRAACSISEHERSSRQPRRVRRPRAAGFGGALLRVRIHVALCANGDALDPCSRIVCVLFSADAEHNTGPDLLRVDKRNLRLGTAPRSTRKNVDPSLVVWRLRACSALTPPSASAAQKRQHGCSRQPQEYARKLAVQRAASPQYLTHLLAHSQAANAGFLATPSPPPLSMPSPLESCCCHVNGRQYRNATSTARA
eukprot:3362479-Pleurochrysis_carterae.AAC.1